MKSDRSKKLPILAASVLVAGSSLLSEGAHANSLGITGKTYLSKNLSEMLSGIDLSVLGSVVNDEKDNDVPFNNGNWFANGGVK